MTASNLGEMHGAGIDAAIAFHRDLANHLDAAGTWAGAMGTGLEIGSTIVQIVHDITRDAIAEVAGAICSYVLEAVFTLGAALPLIIEQASTKALAIATRIGRHIDKLKTALKNLRKLLDDLGKMFDNLATTFRSALSEGGTARKALANDQGSIPAGALIPGASKLEAKLRPAGSAPGNARVGKPDGSVYSVAYEMQLNPVDWPQSRRVHYNRANTELDAAMQSDPQFAGIMEEMSEGIGARVSQPGGRRNPNASDFIWNHAHPDTVGGRHGVMQLIPTYQYTPGSIFWTAIHPGRRGGYAIWGGSRNTEYVDEFIRRTGAP